MTTTTKLAAEVMQVFRAEQAKLRQLIPSPDLLITAVICMEEKAMQLQANQHPYQELFHQAAELRKLVEGIREALDD